MTTTLRNGWDHPLSVASILRAVWPRGTAKATARVLPALHPETVRGWLSGRFSPSAATLLRLAEGNRDIRAELVRRLGGALTDDMARTLAADAFADRAALEAAGVAPLAAGQAVGGRGFRRPDYRADDEPAQTTTPGQGCHPARASTSTIKDRTLDAQD